MGPWSHGSRRRTSAGFLLRAFLEEELEELLFSHQAAELPEGEERQEHDEKDQALAGDLMDAPVEKPLDARQKRLVVQEPHHDLLEDLEREHERAVDQRRAHDRERHRPAARFLAEPDRLADQDDLGDDERLEKGIAVAKSADTLVAL